MKVSGEFTWLWELFSIERCAIFKKILTTRRKHKPGRNFPSARTSFFLGACACVKDKAMVNCPDHKEKKIILGIVQESYK